MFHAVDSLAGVTSQNITNVAALLIFLPARLTPPLTNVLANGGAGAHNFRCNLIVPS